MHDLKALLDGSYNRPSLSIYARLKDSASSSVGYHMLQIEQAQDIIDSMYASGLFTGVQVVATVRLIDEVNV